MRDKLLTLLFVALFFQSIISQNDPCIDAEAYHIVILGSSTAAGSGASNSDSAWVNRYRTYLKNINPENEVTNLAVGGFSTYRIMPDGFVPPANRPAPNSDKNITKAISLSPDGIIVNLPSNDVSSGYSVEEQLANFDTIVQHAENAGIPIWICTTQPKNYPGNADNILKQLDVRDSILVKYAPFTLDFWTGLADSTNQIDPQYDSGDGTHLNDAGHALLSDRVEEAYLPAVLFETNTIAPDYRIFSAHFLDPPQCGQQSATVRIVFYNRGLDGNGSLGVSLTSLYVATGGTYDHSLTRSPLDHCVFDSLDVTIPVGLQGAYEISVAVASADDGDVSNDSMAFLVDVPGVPTIGTFSENGCAETSFQLQATAEAGDSVRWWDASIGGNIVGGGPVFETPVLSQSTTYYPEAVRGGFFYKNELGASENFNIYWNGTMFDLVATADDLVIDSLSMIIADTGSQLVEIYTRPGSHIGHETDFNAWQFQGIAPVQVVDSTAFVTFAVPAMKLPANDTTAIYLQLADPSARLGYLWSNTPATVSTDELTMIAGSGADHNFGGNYFPRFWAGELHYHFGKKPDGDCTSGRIPAEAIVQTLNLDLGADTILDLSETLLLDAGDGFAIYQWSDGSSEQTLDLSGNALGTGIFTYSVTITNDLGCTASDEIIVVFAPLINAANEALQDQFSFFPNPADEEIFVKMGEGDWQLDIVTTGGKTIHSYFYKKQNSDREALDISALPAGFYFLKVVRDGRAFGAFRVAVF